MQISTKTVFQLTWFGRGTV